MKQKLIDFNHVFRVFKKCLLDDDDDDDDDAAISGEPSSPSSSSTSTGIENLERLIDFNHQSTGTNSNSSPVGHVSEPETGQKIFR